jgi:hypothetical protein
MKEVCRQRYFRLARNSRGYKKKTTKNTTMKKVIGVGFVSSIIIALEKIYKNREKKIQENEQEGNCIKNATETNLEVITYRRGEGKSGKGNTTNDTRMEGRERTERENN